MCVNNDKHTCSVSPITTAKSFIVQAQRDKTKASKKKWGKSLHKTAKRPDVKPQFLPRLQIVKIKNEIK
jgi:hypothetical protein